MNISTRIENITATPSRQWLASLSLTFSFSAYGTQLTKSQRKGPLSVQKAFYPEGRDCAHIYLLHPPAGIVSGDELNVSAHLQENAHVLITTPGGNRFYRAREDNQIGDPKQSQTTTITVDALATCENLPQETIVYEGADGVNTVDIHMTSQSAYLGWDITCLGLPSSQQPFSQGSYTQLTRLYCDDVLTYHDRIALSPSSQLLDHLAGLASNTVFGTFLLYAPNKVNVDSALVESLREIITNNNAADKVSITNIDNLLVVRYLGAQAQECKKLFTLVWQLARPFYTQKSGIEPRVWHT